MNQAPESTAFMPLSPALIDGVKHIEQATNWQEKYRQIMLMGKHLPQLDAQFKVETAQVKGCESQAWLYHQQVDDKHFYLADSDSRIVKGLIAVLLVATQGKTSQALHGFDAKQYFDNLGLSGQLSPSRTNGLFALAYAIIAFAE